MKTWTLHKRKVHIKKKGRVYEFWDNGKVDIIYGFLVSFPTQEVGTKMTFS